MKRSGLAGVFVQAVLLDMNVWLRHRASPKAGHAGRLPGPEHSQGVALDAGKHANSCVWRNLGNWAILDYNTPRKYQQNAQFTIGAAHQTAH